MRTYLEDKDWIDSECGSIDPIDDEGDILPILPFSS